LLIAPDTDTGIFAFGDGLRDQLQVMQPPSVLHGREELLAVGVRSRDEEGLPRLEITKGEHGACNGDSDTGFDLERNHRIPHRLKGGEKKRDPDLSGQGPFYIDMSAGR